MDRLCDTIAVSHFFQITPVSEYLPTSAISLEPQRQLWVEAVPYDGRWRAHMPITWSNFDEGWRLDGREQIGDEPGLYHPLYFLALLTTQGCVDGKTPLPDWPIPKVTFTTEENVLRSMTLNGMRMSTEYFQSGSIRVLELVENRLDLGQRDVAHNVLVYLARQVVDVRTRIMEERDLRAESVAAYLGLNVYATQTLFRKAKWEAEVLAREIERGVAGQPKRQLDLRALLEGQIEYSQGEFSQLNHDENRWLWLIDQIAERLYEKGR